MDKTIRKVIDELYEVVDANDGKPPTAFELQIALLEAIDAINNSICYLITAIENLDQGLRSRS